MHFEQNLVSINFKITQNDNAHVSVFDRGFLFGDSVYEVVRTYERRLFHLDRHYQRLERSAQSLGFELPFDFSDLAKHLEMMVDRFKRDDCYLRIIVTRGVCDIALCPPKGVTPEVFVIAGELPNWPEEYYKKGISLMIVNIRRNLRGALNPMIKSGNYLNNVLATMEAKSAGAVDAVMLNAQGHVTESSTANIFIVNDNVLITPPEEAGILDGVSRYITIKLAADNDINCKEALFGPKILHEADESFLTSTTRDIMPIRKVDSFDIRSPGPITLRLMNLYRDYALKNSANN